MRTIAERAGVSVMTVSRALSNHPEISQKTRDRIHTLATELGYRKNPLVSALMKQRSTGKAPGFNTTLAHVHCFPFGHTVRRNLLDLREGIRFQAGEIGYDVEEFYINEPGMTPRRLMDIIKSRGIRGVIFEHFFDKDVELDIDLSGVSSVAIMQTLKRPNINRVVVNEYQAVLTAVDELRKRGYHRCGLILNNRQESMSTMKREAAWLQMNQELADERRTPVLKFDSPSDLDTRFDDWFEKCNPHAIITLSHAVPNMILRRGLRLGYDVGFALLGWNESDVGFAGVDPNWHQVGVAAANQVIDQMNRNEFDVPVTPIATMIEGRWVDGVTAVKLDQARAC